MKELIWQMISFLVTRKPVRSWLIRRAMKTPYRAIVSADGQEIYLARYWLFNPYHGAYEKRWPWLPSIRVHRIMRADQDRALHNHPWNARTIILQGWYFEETPNGTGRRSHCREIGYTGKLTPSSYHRISCVPWDGVWTLFFTWRVVGDWYFMVGDRIVPSREYLDKRAK